MKIHTFILCFLIFYQTGFTQKADTIDFYADIQKQDITDFILVSNDAYGFLGDDYQRFYIHFSSVEKNPENPYAYFVKGKTKVKENICAFTGTITIETAITFEVDEDPNIPGNIRQGKFTACLVLQEDKNQYGAGEIKGTLYKGFTVKATKMQSDELLYYGDAAYDGNYFEGNWVSYKTKQSKHCLWHNGGGWSRKQHLFRTGDDGDLYINHLYIENGWKSFVLARHPESLHIDYNDPRVEKAQLKEKERWWK
ncbi:hypothetical protein [Chitinophaga sp. MM2321]|uniref:hypothetical protein n=1 Tax=Chitinophaga sp. MM2321 TaxID=3137178 RepID=UPI0032D571D4